MLGVVTALAVAFLFGFIVTKIIDFIWYKLFYQYRIKKYIFKVIPDNIKELNVVYTPKTKLLTASAYVKLESGERKLVTQTRYLPSTELLESMCEEVQLELIGDSVRVLRED